MNERFTKTIKDDVSKDLVEMDKSDCFKMNNDRELYLPHNPVVHPHKPVELRRALNGAAKFQGQSLKHALLTGPDLHQRIIRVLFQF